jgi:hypothetical protein
MLTIHNTWKKKNGIWRKIFEKINNKCRRCSACKRWCTLWWSLKTKVHSNNTQTDKKNKLWSKKYCPCPLKNSNFQNLPVGGAQCFKWGALWCTSLLILTTSKNIISRKICVLSVHLLLPKIKQHLASYRVVHVKVASICLEFISSVLVIKFACGFLQNTRYIVWFYAKEYGFYTDERKLNEIHFPEKFLQKRYILKIGMFLTYF